MKHTIRSSIAALFAAAAISVSSVTAYADTLKVIDGTAHRYSESGDDLGLYTGWVTAKGSRAYFRDGIKMTATWVADNGTYYLLLEDGSPFTGRFLDGSALYEFGENGALVSSTAVMTVDGITYISAANGAVTGILTGTVRTGSGLRYYSKGKSVSSTWIVSGGEKTGFADSNGYLVTGLMKRGGGIYRFGDDGKLTDKYDVSVKDGITYISENGNTVPLSGWLRDGEEKYYYKKGKMLKDIWVSSKGVKTYLLRPDGRMAVGHAVKNGVGYLFGEDGKVILSDSLGSENGLKTIKGKALKTGDCIGIAAPAYYVRNHDYSKAVQFLKAQGYKVKVMPSCDATERNFAGSDKQRAEDINALFADDSVDAIMCLRGGYGSGRILDYLDYSMIAKHPKLLIGYSDVTALHIALYQKCGLVTVHGPMASTFNNDNYTGFTKEQFLSGITSDEPVGKIKQPEGGKLKTLVPGSAEGVVIGGNLTLIASLVGTEYELRADHAILFIEEIGEFASRIDRMLLQLYESGLFDRVDGIIIGDMADNYDYNSCSVNDVIREYAKLADKPCITGVPAGHGKYNMFLPFGVKAKMTANKDGSASIEILESALK